MLVHEYRGSNWDAALEVLREGGYIVFQGIGLTLRDFGQAGRPKLGALTATIPSEWQLQNVTEQRALADLARGVSVVESLLAEAIEVRELADQRGLRYELVDDMGKMGAVLIATMVNGDVDWSYAPWRTDAQRPIPDGVRELLSEHGVTGPVRWLHDDEEWVFIVTPTGAANMSEPELVLSLQALLSAKVWVATDGPAWANQGSVL